MAHRHFARQRNMQSKSRYKFFKNPENCKWLKLRKIVYLWRCFSLARKLLMGRFRGPLNYILDVKFKYLYFIADPLNGSKTFFLAEKFAVKVEVIFSKNQENFKLSRVRKMFGWFSIWSNWTVIKQSTWLNLRSRVNFHRLLDSVCSHFLPWEKCV